MKSKRGFTLVEVLVALTIMALVAVLAGQAFQTAQSGSAATREAMDRLAAIDRTFVLMEGDLRNAVARAMLGESGQPLPPLFISMAEDYWMTVFRGGYSNDLFLPRTEEVRVGYRYIDNTIWRDVWYAPHLTDQEQARKRRLLEGVVNLVVEVLPSNAGSFASASWLQQWPRDGNMQSPELPLGVRVTVELEDMGEIERVFAIIPGSALNVNSPRVNQPNPQQPAPGTDGNEPNEPSGPQAD